jgi:hypothetical protein
MDLYLKLAVIPLGIVLGIVVYRTSRPAGGNGPPGLFLLGNALDMPTLQEWVTYANWKKIYGRLNPH